MLSPKIIALEEGWNNEIKAKAIDVLEDMLNTGLDKNKPRLFDPKEYVQTYTTCYNMCTQGRNSSTKDTARRSATTSQKPSYRPSSKSRATPY